MHDASRWRMPASPSEQIGHINAHGTSTPLNDLAEADAITKVFGNLAPPVTSTKGITGHGLGASGAIEAVAVVLSIQHGLIPPTCGVRAARPGDRPRCRGWCGSVMGARPGPLQLLRLRRPQRLSGDRAGLTLIGCTRSLARPQPAPTPLPLNPMADRSTRDARSSIRPGARQLRFRTEWQAAGEQLRPLDRRVCRTRPVGRRSDDDELALPSRHGG